MRAQTRSGQLRLAGLCHPFPWGSRAQIERSDDLRQRLAAVLELSAVDARVPLSQSGHQLTVDRIGRLVLVAWLGTALALEATAPTTPTLYLLDGGRLEVRIGSEVLRAEGGDLLYLPAAAYRATTTACSVIALRPDPAELETALQTIVGRGLPAEERQRMLAQPLALPGREAGARSGLSSALRSQLAMVGQLRGVDVELPELLGLDHQIHQLIATVLVEAHQGLDQVLPAHARRLAGERSFAALIGFLRSNLTGPLTLAVMEQRSGLSRRALQYLFQHHFGCTPMQWLRQERLEQARYQLEHAGPADSVRRIAMRCGYRSPSRFSADFQRQFHCRPSDLLRHDSSPVRRRLKAGTGERQPHSRRIASVEAATGKPYPIG